MTTEEDIARLNMHREIETEEARATPYQRIKQDVLDVAARDAMFDKLVSAFSYAHTRNVSPEVWAEHDALLISAVALQGGDK